MSRLVVMGSGETAPTMVRVHREVLAAGPPGPAVLLDTTFGFQLNADELVARALAYFAQSVGVQVEVASWRRLDTSAVDKEKALALVGRAGWVFAGPGSPTYALRLWNGTPLPDALAGVMRRGGTLVMGSAAAVTLGTHAVPVYEIYKAGAEPYWADGLDLLGALTRLRAAVIPHFDNAEGGTHDTRFCYLGAQRLALLERELPDDVGILGVDEHTAVSFDIDARTAQVLGNRTVIVRRRGSARTFAAGSTLTFDDLHALLAGTDSVVPLAPQPLLAAPPAAGPAPTSLHEVTAAARERFDAGLRDRNVDACIGAILDLEEAIAAWSADTLQSGDTDDARRTLRSFVVRLGALAETGARDPREVLAPYVEALLDVRVQAREAGDFATSDAIRDRLAAAGVEVRDTPDGAEWAPPTLPPPLPGS